MSIADFTTLMLEPGMDSFVFGPAEAIETQLRRFVENVRQRPSVMVIGDE